MEFCGRKVLAVVVGWRASGFLRQAQDRLFALERRAQDDGKNRQRRKTSNGEILRFWLRQNDEQEQATTRTKADSSPFDFAQGAE
jgi:hypothetical protein